MKERKIKKGIKEIVLKAKEKKIIKPHTLAYNDNPVNEEIHKGNINYFDNLNISNYD